jgi:hypothetical protein
VKWVDPNSWANEQLPATTKSSERTRATEVNIFLFIEGPPVCGLSRTDTMEQIGRAPKL